MSKLKLHLKKFLSYFNFKNLQNKKTKINKKSSIVRGTNNSNAPILKLEKVSKNFGHFSAVSNVSFELKRGERIGILGANGAGKTTLTEIIAGLITATSGKLKFGFKFDKTPKENIGMQFQQSRFPSGLTVKDIVFFARNVRKLDISKKELNELLEVFQMQEILNKKASSLSGGQKQKLNILLAILHKPKLVILDEMSSGLDVSARQDIMEFTDNLLTERNLSAIVISHHMSEIKALCSRIVVLDHGVIKNIATISSIEKEYGSLDEYMTLLIKKGIVEEKNKKNQSQEILIGKKTKKIKSKKEGE